MWFVTLLRRQEALRRYNVIEPRGASALPGGAGSSGPANEVNNDQGDALLIGLPKRVLFGWRIA